MIKDTENNYRHCFLDLLFLLFRISNTSVHVSDSSLSLITNLFLVAIFHFVAFCFSSKIWFRSINLCRHSRRVCFISKIFFYLVKIKMLFCLPYDTVHVCLFDTSYISYYLHMVSRSIYNGMTSVGDMGSYFTKKTRFVSQTFLSLNLLSDHHFPGSYDPWC